MEALVASTWWETYRLPLALFTNRISTPATCLQKKRSLSLLDCELKGTHLCGAAFIPVPHMHRPELVPLEVLNKSVNFSSYLMKLLLQYWISNGSSPLNSTVSNGYGRIDFDMLIKTHRKKYDHCFHHGPLNEHELPRAIHVSWGTELGKVGISQM